MKPRSELKLNRKLPVLLLALLLSAPSAPGAADAPDWSTWSRTVEWSRTYDGPGHFADEGIGQALFGDFVYTVGVLRNANGDDDAAAFCHRKDGSLVWSYRFGDSPGFDLFYAVAVDPSGNPYVLGRITTDIIYDNTVIKLFKFHAADNTVVWIRDLLPPGYVSSISERFVYQDDALVLTGNVRKPDGDDDLYVASVSTGNVLNWETIIEDPGGGGDYGREIAAGTGAIFVSGETGGNSNFYVARFRSSDGATEWFNTVSTNGQDTAGNISVAGASVFVSAAVVTGGEITPTLFRFSAANGTEIWRRHVAVLPGSIKNYAGETLSANGTVLFAGTLDTGGGDTDTFLNAYTLNGDLLWRKDLGVPGVDDAPSSIFWNGSRWILLGMFPPDSLTAAAAGFKTFAPDGTPLETVLFNKDGPGTDYVLGGAIDQFGNIFLAGRKSVGLGQDFFIGKAGWQGEAPVGGTEDSIIVTTHRQGAGCLEIGGPARDSSTPWQAGILMLPGFLLLARRVFRKWGCNIRRFEL